MSQPDIATTDFLELCISKKRKVQDITEALGLYREVADTRKEPVFIDNKANDLHKRIKEYADTFRARYRNERETMLADLVKDGVFQAEVQELCDKYGQDLWSRADSQKVVFPQELSWDKEADQHTIRHYLRYWITCYAVQTPIQRKGKARASAAPRDISESESSDLEHPRVPLYPVSTVSPTLPFRAPEVPGMLPPAEISRADTVVVQARLVDNGGNLDIAHGSESRSPITPNGKRKATSFQGQLSSGKLQKVGKDTRVTTTSPRGRPRDIYSMPMSPTPQLSATHQGLVPVGRNQREDTWDSNYTYVPRERQGTEGSETEIDPDEVMAETQELLSNVQVPSDSEASCGVRSPTAGPSGTYEFHRQDSVIPPSTYHGAEDINLHRCLPQPQTALNTSSDIWRSKFMSTTNVDVSKIDRWQVKQLRMELFKLLVSYINDINQFSPDVYQTEAEEKMNSLLYQFWINDAEAMRSKTGHRFSTFQAALEQWMEMRYSLAEFQRTTGYFGKPGEDWKETLRRMDLVAHAKASIAYVDLKGVAVGSAGGRSTTFNDDLMTVFHLLTQVEGCTGVKEFDALRLHNEGLLEWFS